MAPPYLLLPNVCDNFSANVTFSASLSVITPSEVETNAIPKPFNTLGTSFALAYTRKPGLEIRFNPVITRSLF